MTLATNAFTTYSAIGNREDLTDVIYRIDPTETPFMTGIEREKASAVTHEWQTQALAAATTTNAQLEGDDQTADAATATVRLGNVCQISKKTPAVTGTQQAVDHAGRGNETSQGDRQRDGGPQVRGRAVVDQDQHHEIDRRDHRR